MAIPVSLDGVGRSLRSALLASIGLAGVGACSLFVPLDGLDDGSSDAGSDALVVEAGGGDAASDALDLDAPVVVDAGPDAADAGPCNGKPGPAMVSTNGVCIDSTEVTNQQYAEFLTAVGGGAPVSRPAECTWDVDLTPDTSSGDCSSQRVDPGLNPNLPVACIDWCDAYAYCKWAGKRICGNVDGGSLDFNAPTGPEGQWMKACTNNGTQTYPYGNAYQLGACNTVDVDAGAVVAVGTLTACAGGRGIYDLAGNLEEWSDSCDTQGGGGANDHCHESGDAFGYASNGPAKCAQDDYDNRNTTSGGVGIRCCSP